MSDRKHIALVVIVGIAAALALPWVFVLLVRWYDWAMRYMPV